MSDIIEFTYGYEKESEACSWTPSEKTLSPKPSMRVHRLDMSRAKTIVFDNNSRTIIMICIDGKIERFKDVDAMRGVHNEIMRKINEIYLTTGRIVMPVKLNRKT